MYLRQIADSKRAIADADREVADLVHALELPAHTQLDSLAGRLEEACRGHRVLRLQCLLHLLQRQAQRGQLDVGQLDPDFLVLQADQFDLADILDPLQLNLNPVGVILEYRVIKTLAGQRIDIAEGRTKLIVEKRPLNVGRQVLANIADLLADLIPEIRQVGGKDRITRHEGDGGFSRPRERRDALILAGFHEFLFDTIRDLSGHFFGAGARPQCADHHGLEGEGRVFTLPQFGVGQRAHDGQNDHQVQHDLAVTQRPFGKIEVHRAYSLAASFTARLLRSTGRTRSPSRNTCPPAATIQSVSCTP
ncbi:Uncharacterized protein ALO56_05254 [Pseudomonas viridiflava]|nr:Uncharacterized protein ALO56_05254 [Pseudomonas viridiflava]